MTVIGNRLITGARRFLLVAHVVAFVLVGTRLGAATHEHINAGAFGSEAGARLYFVNGDRYAAESGYVIPLEKVESGTHAGLYQGSVTFTALAATLDYGGPAFDHAALGAHIELIVESVMGPQGGRFGFWEGEEGEEGSSLTFQLPVSTDGASELIPLSETPGGPEDDPYGHVHGRVYTATLSGLYRIGLRLRDTSTYGAGGGPLHPQSDPYLLWFQAGVTIARLEASDQGVGVVFGAAIGFSYRVEQSDRVGPDPAWIPVGDSVAGDNHLHTVLVPSGERAMFFRLRRTPS